MDQTPMNEIRRGQTAASTGTRIVAMLSLLGGIGFLSAIVLLFGSLASNTTWVSLWSDPVLGVVMSSAAWVEWSPFAPRWLGYL